MTAKRRALEEYLVVEARLGRVSAKAELVELRGPRLLVHATRLLGNRDEAQDAVQDAWMQIFKGLNSLKNVGAFPAWSTRIVTRCCYRIIDRRVRGQAIAESLAPLTESLCETEIGDGMHLLRQAIYRLPGPQAATVALFYLEEMSLAEVAHALDVPVGTVKSRLSQARRTLKESLKGEIDV